MAVRDGKVVGAILCGHDGRRGCLYHVCVDPEYRMQESGKFHGRNDDGGVEKAEDQ